MDTDLSRQTILPELDEDGAEGLERAADRKRFDPIGTLGMGGLGEVLAARDLDIGRRVAIKRMRRDRASTAAVVRFVQEVRTAGSLDHPNIVPIYDVGHEEDGTYYFVMKYVDGETLESLIGRLARGDGEAHRVWTVERRLALYVQILHAVAFAHGQGVLHRDLKPANVMLGRHGEVQLLDWGVAKRRSDGKPDADTVVDGSDSDWAGSVSGRTTDTRAGSLVGTPRYMAPEQARGEVADERSETYTLALILYELLALEHPRGKVDQVAEVLAAAQKPVPLIGLLPHSGARSMQAPIPSELVWFLADGLSLDRAQRFATVIDMVRFFERRAEGQLDVRCPQTAKKSFLLRVTRWVERYPWSTTFGLAAAVVGGVAAVAGATAAAIGAVAGVVIAVT
ncbi:MAG: serine/threonine-protein kinase [Myxococcota bacterium]